jgi:hypothetical protein
VGLETSGQRDILWDGLPLSSGRKWTPGGENRSIAIVGIDLGKNVCSVVGLDEKGGVVVRRRMLGSQANRY